MTAFPPLPYFFLSPGQHYFYYAAPRSNSFKVFFCIRLVLEKSISYGFSLCVWDGEKGSRLKLADSKLFTNSLRYDFRVPTLVFYL